MPIRYEDAPTSTDEVDRRLDKAARERSGASARSRRAMWIAIGVLAALCLGLLAAQAVGQAKRTAMGTVGVVTGVVVDEQGRPLQAEVVVLGTDLETQTDAAGRFELRGVPAGEREVAALVDTGGKAVRVTVLADATVDLGQIRYVPTRIPDA